MRFVSVRIHRKRTDINKSLDAGVCHASFEKVARRYDTIHEGVRIGLASGAGCQVIDNGGIACRKQAIFGRQEITAENVYAGGGAILVAKGLDRCQTAGSANKAAYASEAL
jgi:hypothetical protein